MSAAAEIEELLEKYKLATVEFVRGNPEPYKAHFSHEEDVTLANPYFPVVRGWDEVSLALERTASRLRDGEFLDSEIVSKYVTDELAYVLQLAHETAKVGGSDEVTPTVSEPSRENLGVVSMVGPGVRLEGSAAASVGDHPGAGGDLGSRPEPRLAKNPGSVIVGGALGVAVGEATATRSAIGLRAKLS